jgi:type IX secretion system PorP/SprF family membrane protein
MNTNISHFILLIILSWSLSSTAQQQPLFSTYRHQWKVLNPASISNNYLLNEMNISLSASHRQQWLGLEDAPNTQLIQFEYLPPNNRKIVTGGHIMRDQAGKLGQIGLYGNFAYRIELGRRVEQTLSIGLGAGLVQYRAELENIAFATPEMASLSNDNVLYPDFSLGAFYHYSDKYYAGISIPQVFGLQNVFRDSLGERAFDIRRVQHWYAVAGAYIDVPWFGSTTSFLEPSIWLRYVPNTPISMDANVRYQISDFFSLGFGGGVGFGERLSSVLHLETGFKLGESMNINNGLWKIGFSYDIPLSQYRSAFGHTFEINFVYAWFN